MRRVTQGIFPTKIPKVLEFQIIPTGWEKQAEVYKVQNIRPNLDIRPVDRFSTTNSDLAIHQHGGWRQKKPISPGISRFEFKSIYLDELGGWNKIYLVLDCTAR